MKRVSRSLIAVVILSALVAGGCARNASLQKDSSSADPSGSSAKTNQTPAGQTSPQQPAAPARPEKPSPPIVDAAQTELNRKQAETKSALAQRLETIYFDYDKSDLSSAARDALVKNAELLKKKSGTVVTIEGHCDERGSAEYNLALGERRAKSTMQYLLTLGVPAERLATVSYGKEKPAVDGHDDAAWAKNRRAEFK